MKAAQDLIEIVTEDRNTVLKAMNDRDENALHAVRNRWREEQSFVDTYNAVHAKSRIDKDDTLYRLLKDVANARKTMLDCCVKYLCECNLKWVMAVEVENIEGEWKRDKRKKTEDGWKFIPSNSEMSEPSKIPPRPPIGPVADDLDRAVVSVGYTLKAFSGHFGPISGKIRDDLPNAGLPAVIQWTGWIRTKVAKTWFPDVKSDSGWSDFANRYEQQGLLKRKPNTNSKTIDIHRRVFEECGRPFPEVKS